MRTKTSLVSTLKLDPQSLFDSSSNRLLRSSGCFLVVIRIALLAIFFTSSTLPARASLVGVTISGCTDSAYNSGSVNTDPASCNSQAVSFDTTAMVTDPGVEFSLGSSRQIDFSSDTVSVIYDSGHGSPSPDLFIFTDLMWVGEPEVTISGLELLTTNDIEVTTAFTDHAIGLLVNAPLASGTTTTVTYRILTVPEPSTICLIGLTIISLGLSWRRSACAV